MEVVDRKLLVMDGTTLDQGRRGTQTLDWTWVAMWKGTEADLVRIAGSWIGPTVRLVPAVVIRQCASGSSQVRRMPDCVPPAKR